jgi:hypothetical protein
MGTLLAFEFVVFWIAGWIGRGGLAPLPTIPPPRLAARRTFLMWIDHKTARRTSYIATVRRTGIDRRRMCRTALQNQYRSKYRT